MPSLLLVNPLADFPTYWSGEVFAGRKIGPRALIADLATPTIAAFASPYLDVTIADEGLAPINFDAQVDYVGITGKVTQFGRMKAIAKGFRDRGRTVIIGGPFASLSPEVVAPHCDILVRGEIEAIADRLFADLRDRNWQAEYIGAQPDPSLSPTPRWDLYPNNFALYGCVQTSRGCPFECEFCDVIPYLGRTRNKTIAQVLAELDVSYLHGYRSIYLADDNFTAYRSRAKELVEAIATWNRRRDDGYVHFTTQMSMDASRDAELLDLCAMAGITHAFVGIETIDEQALREAHKKHNLLADPYEQLQTFLDHGISVLGGLIVGFDADDQTVFRRQLEFAMKTPIPMFGVGSLVAPAATPLHARLRREGRLVEREADGISTPWTSNIIPKQLSHDALQQGMAWLCNELYRPEAFGDRLVALIDRLGPRQDPEAVAQRATPGSARPRKLRQVELDARALLHSIRRLGPAEEAMWWRVTERARQRPDCAPHVMAALVQYAQIRFVYEQGDLWDPQISAPPATPGPSINSLSMA